MTPIEPSPHWPRWQQALERTAKLAVRLQWRPNCGLEIGAPMPLDEIAQLSSSVGPLPSDYLSALRAARSVVLSYSGGIEFLNGRSVGLGPLEALWDDRYLKFCGEVAEAFGYQPPGHSGPRLTAFLHLEDDDFVAFRMDHSEQAGEVVFAPHDRGDYHPRIATSFTELMDRWAFLRFPDLESLLEHFWDAEGGEIRTSGPVVEQWLAKLDQLDRG